MTTKYEVVFTDGLGNPRRWSLVASRDAAERSLARLLARLGRYAESAAPRIVER